jgi:hypothetical protein
MKRVLMLTLAFLALVAPARAGEVTDQQLSCLSVATARYFAQGDDNSRALEACNIPDEVDNAVQIKIALHIVAQNLNTSWAEEHCVLTLTGARCKWHGNVVNFDRRGRIY